MKKNLLILVAIFAYSLTYSQVTKKDTATTNATSSKIRVYTPETSFKSRMDNSYKWAIKTDFLSILTGEFPIIGEYRIGKKFSVEASAALTYGYLNEDLNSVFSEDKEYDQGYLIETSDAEMGSAFRASFKYFASSDYDPIEGWYFGVQVMTKTLNRSYENFDGEYSKVKTGAAIIIGKQVFLDSNIVYDYYFGAGMANVKETQYLGNNNGIGESKITESKTKPNLLFGIRIGFGN